VALIAVVVPAAVQAAGGVQIRHADLGEFPLVRVTALVSAGSKPRLLEGGNRVQSLDARELGSGKAIVLAVDNSQSMRGGPLREAKRAARAFLAEDKDSGRTGLVVFGHEALGVTAHDATKADVARTVAALKVDGKVGTALYDAVTVSASRAEQLSAGTRILVLMTDGRDRGSKASLAAAIDAAQRANLVVYSIAAGGKADTKPLATLASATGGRLFQADDMKGLTAAYRALGRELDRTWDLSYVSSAFPGDEIALTLRASGKESTARLRVPKPQQGGLVPASIARSPVTAGAVVLLAGLLFALACAAIFRDRRRSGISRLLEPHVTRRELATEAPSRPERFGGLLDWTERSLDDLPGSTRLGHILERSGWSRLRLGALPYLGLLAAFVFGIAGSIAGAPPPLALLLMLVGFAAPLVALRLAGQRRMKAFDRQLPDVLATIASTLRAGHGLRTALKGIAEDGAAPTSEEFARVLGEERLGRPLHQAIGAMCERLASRDLDYVATAVNVQAQTGGALAGLFDTLSETVRERQRHARKVRALTALGRASAIILVLLPIGLGALMTLIAPTYMAPLYTTSSGHVVIGVCLTSMAVGGLILKRIVSVRY
jgi:tight adherence protein B